MVGQFRFGRGFKFLDCGAERGYALLNQHDRFEAG